MGELELKFFMVMNLGKNLFSAKKDQNWLKIVVFQFFCRSGVFFGSGRKNTTMVGHIGSPERTLAGI